MPLETSLGANGIMTITFANPKKLNAWTQPMMEGFFDCLQDAGSRSDVAGVVVTGEGKYYSAGVDLSNVMKPMLPSKLVMYLRDSNQKVFQTVIDFPKPIVAAVNGPAIGAAVTSTCLMDACFASPAATFLMLPGALMSKTTIGRSFSRQSATAVWSITRRFFVSASS